MKKLTFSVLLLLVASSVFVSCADKSNSGLIPTTITPTPPPAKKSDLHINSNTKVALSMEDKGTFTVDISSGREFECAVASKDGNWLTFSSPSNNSGHYPAGADIAFNCKFDANYLGEDRAAVLLFKNADMDTYTDTVYVTQSGKLTINLKNPGTLAKEIANRNLDPLKIKGLKLTGALDNKDILTLRTMAGCGKTPKDITKGNLANLDITGVTFVNDGSDSYFLPGGNMAGEIDKVQSLPDYMFQNCISIQKVKLPTIINEIGEQSFHESGLKEVQFPKTLKTIKAHAFSKCIHLTDVNIPDGVTLIDMYAFDESGLTTVTIPKTITLINSGAFQFCKSLKTVIINKRELNYQSIVPGSQPFDSNGNAILYVPKGTLKEYMNPDFEFTKFFKNRIQEQQ